jgi:hypothetical protein
MKTKLTNMLLITITQIALTFATGCTAATVTQTAPQKPLKVLFIGNSYIGRGNLPEVISQMAKAKGKQIEYTAHTPGGRTLNKHWDEAKAQKLIAQGNWDIVVLQDQSMNPASAPRNMLKYANMFCKEIDKIKAEKIFYLTFAYKAPPKWFDKVRDPAQKKLFEKIFANMQQLLTDTYLKASRQNNARVAPAGIAWQMAYKQNPHYPLHSQDNSHPANLGVYLTALTFYATLFNEPPIDMPGKIETYRKNNSEEKIVIIVDDTTRKKLERIAWQAVKAIHPAAAP